jgi:endonuclease/exonuclease/phosphatase (EEP) superfamily protein YafD
MPYRRAARFALGAVAALALLWLASRPSVPDGPSPPGTLRLGTVNLNAQNTRPEAATSALAAARLDVLVVQEWTGHNANLRMLREAGLQVVLSDARRGTHGAALLARRGAVLAARIVPAPWRGPCSMPLVTARLKIGDRRVGLIAAHAPPPVPACWSSRHPFLQGLARLVRDGRATRSIGTVSKGLPLVVAGDLNALGWEGPLRQLAGRGLTDAFDEGTWRLGPTWSPTRWLPALLPIDDLWSPQNMPVRGAWTLHVPGSDHRAVITDLSAE